MKTFKRLLSYFKHEPLKYTFGIILSFVSAMTAIYAPLIGKEMIDYVSLQINAQEAVELSFLFQKFGWFMIVTLFSPTRKRATGWWATSRPMPTCRCSK